MTSLDAFPRSEAVLIVGAGPTGLTLANALAVHGTNFDIVEARPGLQRDSKALVINAASQHGFDLLGLRGAIGSSGVRLSKAHVLWQGKRLTSIDFRRAEPCLGQFIAQPQADTEQDLIDALTRQGRRVEWSTRLVEAVQDEDGVDTIVSCGQERLERRRYAFVVGCDGKHSAVRSGMPVRFEGAQYPMHFLLGDFPMQWDAPTDQATYHVWEDFFFIFIPIGRGRWRVVLKRDGVRTPGRGVLADEITRPITERLGRDIFTGAPAWLSSAPFYHRLADRLRHRRLMLAGDSAHLFSPIGGTGMNTGMQDAFNLAWKLSHVLSGTAAPSLLDSYQQQRMEAIQAAAQAADQSTRLISRLEKGDAQTSPLLPKMKNRPLLRHVLPRAYTGLAWRYPSMASKPTVAGPSPHVGVGGPCLALPRVMQAVRAVGAWRPRAATLLIHASALSTATLPALLGWSVAHADTVQCVVLGDPGSSAPGPLLFLGGQDELVRDIGLVPGELMFVLPDGVVAHQGTADRLDTLETMASSVFHPPATIPQRSGLRDPSVQLTTHSMDLPTHHEKNT